MKMKNVRETVPVRGQVMKNNMEATKDKSVMTPKNDLSLSATFKNEKSMPNKLMSHKFEDGMIPVSGKNCGKKGK
jgi:hypothetical protein